MFERLHSSRRRDLRPSLDSLEERALLSAGLPHHVHEVRVSADVIAAKHDSNQPQASRPSITILNTVSSRGYRFTNFDGPNAGNLAGTGTMVNGIANSTTVAGYTIANDGKTLTNFTANPPETTKARLVNINGSTTAMALGINSTGTVVGTDGHGNAFSLNRHGVLRTFIPNGGSSAVALGINDRVNIVGQFVTSTATPGFVLVHGGTSFLTINAPSGPNIVNAQGVNNADTGGWVLRRHRWPGPRLRCEEERCSGGHPHPESRTRPSQPSRGNPAPRLCSPRSLGSTTSASRSATTATPPAVSMASFTTPIPGSTLSWMTPTRRSATAWR